MSTDCQESKFCNQNRKWREREKGAENPWNSNETSERIPSQCVYSVHTQQTKRVASSFTVTAEHGVHTCPRFPRWFSIHFEILEQTVEKKKWSIVILLFEA